MTLEIKSDRRNLTFGSGEPAISHEKAVEIVKEILALFVPKRPYKNGKPVIILKGK